MADLELEAITKEKAGAHGTTWHGKENQQNTGQPAQDDAKREAEDRRQLMLTQILSIEARERLGRIALVKPDKARGVEDVLLRAFQMGRISEKVSEERLITLLEQINTQTASRLKLPSRGVGVYLKMMTSKLSFVLT
ncbi:hypothetical protein LUZ60_012924 [Juncus effusus]|nr:hypothetical protein LUZ60_012924 [Juncus effusus]